MIVRKIDYLQIDKHLKDKRSQTNVYNEKYNESLIIVKKIIKNKDKLNIALKMEIIIKNVE